MIFALTVIHIAIAAAWFGHKLLIPGDIRRSMHAGQDEWEALVARLTRAERFGVVTGLGTLMSGAVLMWAVGIEEVSLWIWVGAGLVLVAVGFGAVVARPASRQLKDAVAGGDRVAATVAGRQISRVLGVESLLWLGALVTMLA